MQHAKLLNDNLNNNLYSNVAMLYSEMLQQLAQNNVEYVKTMFSSLNVMQPLSNQGNPEVILPLQNMFTETLKNNQKLFESAQEIISSTKDKIMEVVKNQDSGLAQSPINLFKLWGELNPSAHKMLKTVQDSIMKNVSENIDKTKANLKGAGITTED